jgi:uncharacterized membrane protein HdeD (DUF308 family)
MQNQISKHWYIGLVKGIIMMMLAIVVFVSPGAAVLTYVLWIGLGFILSGIIRIAHGLAEKNNLKNWGGIVLEGVIDLFLGYILLANPAVTEVTLPLLIGLWAAFYGLGLVIDAFSETGNMGLKLVTGILIFVLANAVMFHPVLTGITLVAWLGPILLIIGIYNMVISFHIKE